MPEKEWCITLKNETGQDVVVDGSRTEGITEFNRDLPIVVKPNKSMNCSFSTQRTDYTQEGGGLEIKTTVQGLEGKAYFYILGGNIGLSSDNYDQAYQNASNQAQKELTYNGKTRVLVQVVPGGAMIKYQYVV